MFLVTIETVKIKDYLFSTNKLKVIRGASYLLDYLNQVVVKDVLKKHGIEDKEEDKNYLYVAAGNAKFLVDTEEKADEIIKKVKKEYKKIAPGAKLATSKVEQVGDEMLWDLLDRSGQETANVKNKGFSEVNYHLPFLKKCDLCETNVAEIDKDNLNIEVENYLFNFDFSDKSGKTTEIYDSIFNNLKKDGEAMICKECLAKLISSEMVKPDNEKIGFYSKFRVDFKKEFNDFDMAQTIEHYKDNKSFIGFVYADGDGLGDFLSKLKNKFVDDQNEDDYRKFLKEFSIKLDEVTKDSLIKAMKELKDKFPTHGENKERYYGEFLIVGGDDVCGVFPADLALELSEKYQAIFEKEMYKYFEESSKEYFGKMPDEKTNITTSSGVVIAKAKTPMYLLFDQSIKLQKSAKKERYKNFKDEEGKKLKKHGYTDFQVIGSEGNVDINAFRSEIKLDDLIQRPYEVSEEGSQLLNFIDKIKKFKKEDFPRNKIRKFYDLKQMGDFTEALYEFVNLYNKLTKEQQQLLEIELNKETKLEDILKDIFDILEMYSFVQEGDVK